MLLVGFLNWRVSIKCYAEMFYFLIKAFLN